MQCGGTLQLARPTIQRDYLALLESFRYYEESVVPNLFPRRPGQWAGVDRAVPWHEAPLVLQNCLTVAFRSMHLKLLAGSENHDLCYYRGLALTRLQDALPSAIQDPQGIVLSCILLLVGAELFVPPYSSWILHFEAAQRVIHLRGGISRCLRSIRQPREVLLPFIYQDILTGTCASSETLRDDSTVLIKYPDIIRTMFSTHVSSQFLFPVPLLAIISQVNHLRTTIWSSSSEANVEGIFQRLENFAAGDWARFAPDAEILRNVIDKSPGPEQMTALVRFAECCRLATLLYAGLACPTLAPAVLSSSLRRVLQQLLEHIVAIFVDADRHPYGPLTSKLWRYMRWPSFVAAYACIGWFPDLERNYDDGNEAECRVIKLLLGSTSDSVASGSRLQSALGYFARVRGMRALSPRWTWDDGFPVRCCLFITRLEPEEVCIPLVALKGKILEPEEH